jgi:hypothetical protein
MLCPLCMKPPVRGSNRCAKHGGKAWGSNRPSASSLGYDSQHAALSVRIREAWVAKNGWVCPGWNRPPHPRRDLALHHIDGNNRNPHPANLTVLCTSCNTAEAVTRMNAKRKAHGRGTR